MDLSKYAMPWQLQKMIQWLEKRSPTFWREAEYKDLFNHGHITVYTTSIVCAIVVTNLIVNILLLQVYYLLIKYG